MTSSQAKAIERCELIYKTKTLMLVHLCYKFLEYSKNNLVLLHHCTQSYIVVYIVLMSNLI
jgi:hypothetical protein